MEYKVYSRRYDRMLENPEITFHGDDISVIENNTVIDDYVLMRNTHVQDNYGNEFFDRDVVINEVTGDVGQVKYDEGCFYVKEESTLMQLFEVAEDYVTIGNIHTHPEILDPSKMDEPEDQNERLKAYVVTSLRQTEDIPVILWTSSMAEARKEGAEYFDDSSILDLEVVRVHSLDNMMNETTFDLMIHLMKNENWWFDFNGRYYDRKNVDRFIIDSAEGRTQERFQKDAERMIGADV